VSGLSGRHAAEESKRVRGTGSRAGKLHTQQSALAQGCAAAMSGPRWRAKAPGQCSKNAAGRPAVRTAAYAREVCRLAGKRDTRGRMPKCSPACDTTSFSRRGVSPGRARSQACPGGSDRSAREAQGIGQRIAEEAPADFHSKGHAKVWPWSPEEYRGGAQPCSTTLVADWAGWRG
jgi:hypothetical protein